MRETQYDSSSRKHSHVRASSLKTAVFSLLQFFIKMAARKPTDDDYIDVDDTYDANQDEDAGTGGYAWEEEYKRSWDILQEDSEGRLSSVVSQLQQQRKRRRYPNVYSFFESITEFLF